MEHIALEDVRSITTTAAAQQNRGVSPREPGGAVVVTPAGKDVDAEFREAYNSYKV